MKDKRVIEQLEILAAAYPWDEVAIKFERTPEGNLTVWVSLSSRYDLGISSAYEDGETPEEAVKKMIERNPPEERDPAVCRNKKVAELQTQIKKLQLVVIGLPPYRPGTRLAQFVEVHDA